MNQQTDYRTSSEALVLMGAWIWLFISTASLIGAWGDWPEMKFPITCLVLSIAFILRDHKKQRNKMASVK